MAHVKTMLDLIAGVPLFGGCRGRDLQEVGRLADEVDVPAGRVLMREGEAAHEFAVDDGRGDAERTVRR